MDAERQALDAFRDAAPRMPDLLRWAMAGALCIGFLLGTIVSGLIGYEMGRRARY